MITQPITSVKRVEEEGGEVVLKGSDRLCILSSTTLHYKDFCIYHMKKGTTS